MWTLMERGFRQKSTFITYRRRNLVGVDKYVIFFRENDVLAISELRLVLRILEYSYKFEKITVFKNFHFKRFSYPQLLKNE